jgi:hypothetical protein
MTTVSIVAIPAINGELSYYAVAGNIHSFGQTAGEALDAITSKIAERITSTLIIIQYHRPDQYFSAKQQKQLAKLMQNWRDARDANQSLPGNQQAELETLIETELLASASRAQALLNDTTL